MDSNYYWGFVAAIIGTSAGFQGIYESYRKDAFISAGTAPGILYLLSRAAVPAATFCLLFGTHVITANLWLWALISGTGSEALLRSNFFIKKADAPSPGAPATSADVMVGPLDLLKWWQDLALVLIGPYLSRNRLRFVKKHTPRTDDFQRLCLMIKDHLLGLQNQDVVPGLYSEIDTLSAEYIADHAPDPEHYRIQLGLRLERPISRKEFITVVGSTTT
jgi:hypothetical protein